MPLEIVIDDNSRIKLIKTQLEKSNSFVKPIKKESGSTIIRTNLDDIDQLSQYFPNETIRSYEIDSIIEKNTNTMIHDILGFTQMYFQDKLPVEKLNELLEHVPLKYSIYPPILLLNNSNKRSFDNDVWSGLLTPEYYHQLLKFLASNGNLTVVAINRPILEEGNLLRKPYNLEIIYSMEYPNDPTKLSRNDLWCQVKQNGIWQVWNPIYTMFSRGNIKEKKRILDTFPDVKNNDIVDLYCGIGYFSLSYLSMGCRNLFGFELNSWSIEAFKRGLKCNKNFGKSITNEGEPQGVHLYNENNEMSDQRLGEFRAKNNNNAKLRIRHINMGLLPSSEQGYPVAIEILSHHHNWVECPKVTLHVHENASIEEINGNVIQDRVISKLTHIAQVTKLNYQFQLIHLEKIKTFAPDVWHICLDIDVVNATPNHNIL